MLTATAVPSVHSTADLRVKIVSQVQALEDLRYEWQQLQLSNPRDCLFLTWEWLATWWKHLAAKRELSIALVSLDHRLIALAPLCRQRPAFWSGHPFPAIEFLGAGVVGSDYLDFLVRGGYEAAAIDALTGHFTAQRTLLRLSRLPGAGSVAGLVVQNLQAEGWSVRESKREFCPFVRLAGHTWHSYLDSLGAEHRAGFRRKWRRLQSEFEVDFRQVESRAECKTAIDNLIRLHLLRRRDRGGSDAFHQPELIAFHREFAPRAFEQGWLRLYTLWLNGVPAASLYGFRYGQRFYFYQSGFDPNFEQYAPGVVTMGLAIQKAIEERVAEFDFLHGTEKYKSHWANEARELSSLEVYPPGTLFKTYKHSREWANRLRVAVRPLQSRGALA